MRLLRTLALGLAMLQVPMGSTVAAGADTAALRRAGIAASESGAPFTALVRLGQYLDLDPLASDRVTLEAHVARAREALLEQAPRQSLVLATVERRAEPGDQGERHVVRLAARHGAATLEALSGPRLQAPRWERGGAIDMAAYLALLRRLLDAPALRDEFSVAGFDPNAPRPWRAATLRLIIGDEERYLEARGGEPYERLRPLAGLVIDFARSTPTPE
jgi:hypothetical protein